MINEIINQANIQTDFGQIEIYNQLFEEIDDSSIKNTPIECIDKKLNYSGIYRNREIPIMIGSKFDKFYNPLYIKGYFIIDGLCKSINNIKIKEKISYYKNKAYLTDGSKIEIKQMFDYTISIKGKSKKWRLPINWKDIIKFSINKVELEKHLELVYKLTCNDNPYQAIKNEVDLISLCYMFECWLGLRKEVESPWRVLTPGEIIKDVFNRGEDIIKAFRTNTWSIKYIDKVTTVSENMKHYNVIHDIESIRRITIPTKRENTNMYNRLVKYEDKYKICPVQTPDGGLCGTVSYLCKDCRITNNIIKINVKKGSEIHLFINSKYITLVDKDFIENLNNKECNVILNNKLCFIFTLYGRIIKSSEIISYTASLLPHRKNNPPIRSMFTCSMLKQAITNDKNLKLDIIDNTKTLVNGSIGHLLNVAIMPWYGFNIEDAIVINKTTSIKFRSRKSRIYRENNIKIINKYVKVNDVVEKGSMLYRSYNPKEIKTINIVYSEESGIVKEIINENNFFKIVIIKENNLEVGDKMTNRHGQKGVVSIIENDNDMPFYYNNNKREKIDLIINPHAFPSRMTMGQIKEMGEKEEEVFIGNKAVKNKIIVGKCLYMSLRHQVDEKVQHRNSGKIDIITKQPIPGKKNNGGIRFGQMERDILIGIGAWNTLKELWSIDKTTIYVCNKTGKINPNCCKELKEIHQYFKICLSYIRALGYDILWKNNKYSIIELNLDDLEKTNTLKFGDIDPLDVRIYKKTIVLPLCLRSNKLNSLYTRYINKTKEIKKETKRLLKSKDGAYHQLVEGHRIDKCIRSVITPNPKLDINTVEIPLSANISSNYGILNRQPSLNVDSFKIVKLIKGKNKTISFNPLLCKSFNADFDGDEMNIYCIENEESIKELKEKLINREDKTQDYILGKLNKVTENGLTANINGIKRMIKEKSKGNDFSLEHMYNKIGNVIVNNKVIGSINKGYNDKLDEDEWYKLCMAARESIASISVNTPITGHLQSTCIQMYT